MTDHLETTPEPVDVRQLALDLAVLAAIKDVVAREEKATKAALEAAMDPGDRKTVTLEGEKTSVGTLTFAAPNPDAPGWVVTDKAALLEWAREHEAAAVVEEEVVIEARLLDWFTAPANLGALVERHGGEVMPGVVWEEPVARDPYLSLRRSPVQKEALLGALRAGKMEGRVSALGLTERPATGQEEDQ